ncbi:MAG: sn-glycerol-3-phosphate ABC transporter ATP-binding protein UgpC [Candidatus Neomarinimicrobiota bacterium]
MAGIEFKNIIKHFDQNMVLDNLSLKVRDGEFLVLVGPSGCGKSTTLRLLSGLEELTSGEIYIDNKLVNDFAPKDRNISMVFQNYALYPHMTVYENMSFGLKLQKCPKEEIKKRVEETAETLEISDLLKRKPKQLSGGQCQRVALGRAIVRNPSVFLFDEPLSNLDAKLRVQMRTEIKKLHIRLKTTMIYVTHDQVEAMTLGDRIAVMKDGIIHQIGTSLEVYNHPSDMFVAGFIGSPAMNFIPMRLNEKYELISPENDFILFPSNEHWKKLKSHTGKDMVLGIRPEEISLEKKDQYCSQIQVKVDVAEPLGYETLIHAKYRDLSLVCKVQGFQEKINGESLDIYLNMGKANYFNAESCQAI